jgi:hypothetical protein
LAEWMLRTGRRTAEAAGLGLVKRRAMVGGLHSRYDREAA